MGKIKQGILGGFSGSVGGVVGSSWKGTAVIKAKPISVANPKTASQIAQRNKMSGCVSFLQKGLADVIKPLNDRFAGKMSGYNYALQESITAFDENGALAIPANFKISRSKAKAQLIDAIAAEANLNEVKASWTSIAGQGSALATDKMYIMAYDAVSGLVATVGGTVLRSANQAIIKFPEGFSNTDCNIHVYMAALRADGTVGFAQDYKSFTV